MGTGSQWQGKYLSIVSEYKRLSNKPVDETVRQLLNCLLLSYLPITPAVGKRFSFRVLEYKATEKVFGTKTL